MNLCIDPILKEILGTRGVECEIFDSVLSFSEKQKMLENLESFASNWFLIYGRDITEYRGVSIGAAIHDDVLIFLYFFCHISSIIEKVKRSNIVFYQSISCLLPEPVAKFLKELGVKVVTTRDRYPYPCFRQAFVKEANARKTYSGIRYRRYLPKMGYGSMIKGKLRSLYTTLLCIALYLIYKKRHRTIYFWPIRRLMPILSDLVNADKKRDFNLVVPFPQIIQGVQGVNTKEWTRPLKMLLDLRRLAKRGIFVGSLLSGHMRTFSRFRKPSACKALKSRYLKNESKIGKFVKDTLEFTDGEVLESFTSELRSFFLCHLNDFVHVIELSYLEFMFFRPETYVVEFANPFLSQVVARYNKNIFFTHVSRFLNNQYFCEDFFRKINGNFQILVTSEFENERILKQGFQKKSIIAASEKYFKAASSPFGHRKEQITNYLKGKQVLVIPPPLRVLWDFRIFLSGEFFGKFLQDVILALDTLSVSRIIVRPNPGQNRAINDLGFIANDVYKLLVKDIELKCKVLIRDNAASEDLLRDLDRSALVIGTLSAVSIDSALAGLDYVAYDNSVVPFPESMNLSIFSDGGPIPVISSKYKLIEYLRKYEPNNGRKIINFISHYEADFDVLDQNFIFNLTMKK